MLYGVCWAHRLLMFALVAVVVFVTAWAERFVSRLTRESLCQSRQSNQSACPYLGPALRVPSLRRCSGGRRAGPSMAPRLSRLLPLNPLHNDSARPAMNGAGRSRSKAPLPNPLPQAGEGADPVRSRVFVTPLPLAGEGADRSTALAIRHPSPARGRGAGGERPLILIWLLIYPPRLSQAEWNRRVRG